MHANTCRNCFKACLWIGRIHIRECRFMDASSKARQVNAPFLPACFLNYISCHPISCLKNAYVRNISTQKRLCSPCFPWARLGAHLKPPMLQSGWLHCHSTRMGAWTCAAPSLSALVKPGLIRWGLITQPNGQTISLLLTEHYVIIYKHLAFAHTIIWSLEAADLKWPIKDMMSA